MHSEDVTVRLQNFYLRYSPKFLFCDALKHLLGTLIIVDPLVHIRRKEKITPEFSADGRNGGMKKGVTKYSVNIY